ncbi:UNVERIFIED_CONTAM: hypothetical protein HDU68_001497, partial [Siphonaria sp. JEL0065]
YKTIHNCSSCFGTACKSEALQLSLLVTKDTPTAADIAAMQANGVLHFAQLWTYYSHCAADKNDPEAAQLMIDNDDKFLDASLSAQLVEAEAEEDSAAAADEGNQEGLQPLEDTAVIQ